MMRLGCISSTSTLAAISASSFGTSTTGFPFIHVHDGILGQGQEGVGWLCGEIR